MPEPLKLSMIKPLIVLPPPPTTRPFAPAPALVPSKAIDAEPLESVCEVPSIVTGTVTAGKADSNEIVCKPPAPI